MFDVVRRYLSMLPLFFDDRMAQNLDDNKAQNPYVIVKIFKFSCLISSKKSNFDPCYRRISDGGRPSRHEVSMLSSTSTSTLFNHGLTSKVLNASVEITWNMDN